MMVQLLRSDGSVCKTIDLDSFKGERLNVALLECYADRLERSMDPIHHERTRRNFKRQADVLEELLEDFFPGSTT